MSKVHLVCGSCGAKFSSRIGINYRLPSFSETPLNRQGIFRRRQSMEKMRHYILDEKAYRRILELWRSSPLYFREDEVDLYYCAACHRLEERHFFRIRLPNGEYESGLTCRCGNKMKRVSAQPIYDSRFDDDGRYRGQVLHEGLVTLYHPQSKTTLPWRCPQCGGQRLCNDTPAYALDPIEED